MLDIHQITCQYYILTKIKKGENSTSVLEFSPRVEPEGIEPSSREDDFVPSTCLVDIYCRELQGHQQPKQHLSYCVYSRA
jgi:hypothetical protein